MLQLSLDKTLSFSQHIELARSLRPLRDDGVLIMGSGNITHNLRQLIWDQNPSPVPWAVEFDQMIAKALVERDEKVLRGETKKDLWRLAQPHPDHYIPVLYTYATSDENESVQFVHEQIDLGTLSMRSFRYG